MSSSSSEAAGSATGGGGSFGDGEDSPHGRCKKEEGDGEKSKALDKGEEDVDKTRGRKTLTRARKSE